MRTINAKWDRLAYFDYFLFCRFLHICERRLDIFQHCLKTQNKTQLERGCQEPVAHRYKAHLCSLCYPSARVTSGQRLQNVVQTSMDVWITLSRR